MKDLIVAGDTLDYVTAVPDYPASDGWTLKYQLVPRFTSPTQSPITITATTYEITDYRVSVAPATTATYSAGQYAWYSWVEKSGARQTIADGFVEVKTNPATAAQGFDARSLAQKAFDDAQTALANFSATGGRVKRYSIAGREMEFDTAAELVALVKYWENEVSKEAAQNAKRAGRADPRRMYVRYARG